MSFLNNTSISLSREAVFAIAATGALLLMYFLLRAFRARRSELACNVDDTSDDETVAAISAAVAVILNEEADREGRHAPSFRVVAFRRTNNRRAGE